MVQNAQIKLKPSWSQRRQINDLTKAFRQACQDIWNMGASVNNYTEKDLLDHIVYLPQKYRGLNYNLENNPWGLPPYAIHSATMVVAQTHAAGLPPNFSKIGLLLGTSSFSFISGDMIEMKVLNGETINVPVGSYGIVEQAGVKPGTDWLTGFTINRAFDASVSLPPLPPNVAYTSPIKGDWHKTAIQPPMLNKVDGITNKPQLSEWQYAEIHRNYFGEPLYQAPSGARGSSVPPNLGGTWNGKTYLSQDPRLSGKMS